jgi:protein AroM
MAALMGLDYATGIVERGALDGLDPGQIAACRPGAGDFHLATRLADGREVIVAKEKILPLMDRAVKEVCDQGVDAIILLCNGPFPDFDVSCLVLEPQRLVNHCLKGIVRPHMRLGVMLPMEEQVPWAKESLADVASRITTAVWSPYSDESRLQDACEKLEEVGCDLAILYCMGFNARLGARVRNLVSMPVMVSSSLVARIAGELKGAV